MTVDLPQLLRRAFPDQRLRVFRDAPGRSETIAHRCKVCWKTHGIALSKTALEDAISPVALVLDAVRQMLEAPCPVRAADEMVANDAELEGRHAEAAAIRAGMRR